MAHPQQASAQASSSTDAPAPPKTTGSDGGLTPIGEPLKALANRLASRSSSDEQRLAEYEERERERERRAAVSRMNRELSDLIASVGLRYKHARLSNYEAAEGAQQEALARVVSYADEIDVACEEGRGLLLYGPPGTGKDHLAIGALVKAIAAGRTVAAVDGQRLFQQSRDAISNNTPENEWLRLYLRADVLLLSDPLPPLEFSGPREHQLSILWRIIDDRYRNLRPTVVTANVSDRAELDRRLAPNVVERLIDGSVVIACKWPSYRKAAK